MSKANTLPGQTRWPRIVVFAMIRKRRSLMGFAGGLA
jgi:hypothetical protein